MRTLITFCLLLLSCWSSANLTPYDIQRAKRLSSGRLKGRAAPEASLHDQQELISRGTRSPYYTNKTSSFWVDGTAIPDVDFDIGESYAGLLPISSEPDESRKFYFWFFPSENPAATDEILIWLNGGPGCSSLEGLLQENGPFQWQYGTYKPVPNPWTWVNLTNVVWIDQPIGTGFSQGENNITTEAEMASQFLGFYRNFVQTFDLTGKNIFIAGESYSGQYVPHIASAMLDQNDTETFNLNSTMILDPLINSPVVLTEVFAANFLNDWQSTFSLNKTTVAQVQNMSIECGYQSYIEDNLLFPPKGPLPPIPDASGTDPNCAVWETIADAVAIVNPCWDIYHITNTCPQLWDVLGWPGTSSYLPPGGGSLYFDRADVKTAIHAPMNTTWTECTDAVIYNTETGWSTDSQNNLYAPFTVLPGVIERSQRTIIGHGNMDFLLLSQASLLTIQNMTWAGQQGFQSPVDQDFMVPAQMAYQDTTLAGSGVMGSTKTERGLTFVEVSLSGHMVPQYQPAAAFRLVEFLLGRVSSISESEPFTNSSDGLVAQQDAPDPSD
ncbi:serine carboxypeptidase [Botrytis cinerea]|uniref:Similar to serine carboxypeptidase (CpdS) (Secreted protein) n=1 Tax=Botryotinia fuckeliana (strain T4) TaxID=999810 RepID=G2XWS7_BOTF4|nr:similar to serine carboxypeptidase (CpdS) (secreted protein) [Botrytis cinerea T4]